MPSPEPAKKKEDAEIRQADSPGLASPEEIDMLTKTYASPQGDRLRKSIEESIEDFRAERFE